MALSADKKAMLKTQAAAGDIHAIEALSLEATGRAGFISLGAIAAKSAVSLAASQFGDAATNPLTIAGQPDAPRNVRAVFGSTWDGGNIVVTGTNQFGAAVTETLVAVANSTVVGTKIFKTVTSIAKSAVGVGTHATNTVTVGTGDKLGLSVDLLDTMGLGLVQATPGAANTPEALTVDSANDAVTFTTVPDGTKVLVALVNF